MARPAAPRRYVVRLDPGIWVDTYFTENLSVASRVTWFSSLIYLAEIGNPNGIYPYGNFEATAGHEAPVVFIELIGFGFWRATDAGFLVQPYGGCRVLPEQRRIIPRSLREFVYQRDGYRCVTCGNTERLSCDHIIPWSHGGSDDPSNLQTMCQPCNSRKGARV